MGGFLTALMGGGGPSAAMQADAAKQSSLADEYHQDYSQLFGQRSDIFNQLKNSYSPIISMGAGQHGFTSPVLNSLNAQALNSAGAANTNAMQAARNYGAGQGGGGTSGLASGIQKQILGSIASSSANALGAQQGQIVQQDYATGRDNYFKSLQGAQNLASEMNPNQTGKLASGQLDSAYSSASNINDEKNVQQAALWGGLTSLAGNIATGGMSGAISGGLSMLGGGGKGDPGHEVTPGGFFTGES